MTTESCIFAKVAWKARTDLAFQWSKDHARSMDEAEQLAFGPVVEEGSARSEPGIENHRLFVGTHGVRRRSAVGAARRELGNHGSLERSGLHGALPVSGAWHRDGLRAHFDGRDSVVSETSPHPHGGRAGGRGRSRIGKRWSRSHDGRMIVVRGLVHAAEECYTSVAREHGLFDEFGWPAQACRTSRV